MTTNKAAAIRGARTGAATVVQEVPYPQLEDDLIIVKTEAYAVNPTDWKHIYPEDFGALIGGTVFRKLGFGYPTIESIFSSIGSTVGYWLSKPFTWLQKGNVVGSDISGIVVAVGKSVTNFKIGDVVSSSLHGGVSQNGGFAEYVLVSPNATVKFPKPLKHLTPGNHPSAIIDSYEAASSIGVGLKTVILSLHCDLGVPLTNNDTILIWGGASATGILAIQVAKSVFGLNVVTTASKKHHGFLKELGADKTFDYHDADVVAQLKKENIKYGMDCVSKPSTLQAIYDATDDSQEVSITNLLFMTEKDIVTKPGRKVHIAAADGYLVDGRVHFGKKALPELLESYLLFWNEYTPSIVQELRTAPLKVLEPGLESAAEGLGLLVDGKVSGQKVVFGK